MIAFKCLDLQKRIGDIRRAVLHSPVVITAHEKPQDVLLSVEEFCRLKRAAEEAAPLGGGIRGIAPPEDFFGTCRFPQTFICRD